MAEIVIPLIYYTMLLGVTLDLREYRSYNVYRNERIFNESVLETEVSDFYSNYYVYPDEKIPYSKFSLPIDLKLKDEQHLPSYNQFVDYAFKGIPKSFDAATVVIVSEYKKLELSLEKYEDLFPGWNKDPVIKNHTHYLAKLHHGDRCISTIRVRSNVSGDVQIFRRILKDVMGQSGSMEEETIGLWSTAYEAMKRSEDVRGQMSVYFGTLCSNLMQPTSSYEDTESFLEFLANFPKYSKDDDYQGDMKVLPIYVTLRPLEELDSTFVSVERSELSECYLRKVAAMFDDLEYVSSRERHFYYIINKGSRKARKFFRKVNDLKHEIAPLACSQSIFTAINVAKYDPVFEKYYEGLNQTTESYFMVYKRLFEEIAMKCGDHFHKPVRGSLFVEENEVVHTKCFCLAECQKQCLAQKKCRSVGYSEDNNQCLIYSRSTRSAKILFPEDSLDDMKVYDRICETKRF